MEKIKIPKGETPMVSYFNENQERVFELTKLIGSDLYFLYRVVDGTLQRIGKGKSPIGLEAKFKINEELRG